jgi:hypothetical protein
LEVLESRQVLSTLTVTSIVDSGAGSLRAEIAVAKNNDTIVFDPSLDNQTIKLTSGELYVNTPITISGPCAAQLTISGGNASRIFEVASNNQVMLSGLTISNGNAGSGGPGGGILNNGNLTVSHCTLTGNRTGTEGGGIFSDGTLNVTESTFSGNSASGGGAIENNSGKLSVTESTLSGNSASQEGGGIRNDFGSTSITDTTLSGNSADPGGSGYGGAIANEYGTLIVSDSTLSNNPAAYGGAIVTHGDSAKATVTGCTLTDDNPLDGYLMWVGGGTLTVKNSDFQSASGEYIDGPYKDGGGNTFA